MSSESDSNRSVRVPIHSQRPGMSGVRVAGTSASASWPRVPIGTIGWLNVIETNGARSTEPSGWIRSTSSGPFAASGRSASVSGGNGVSISVAACGGGGLSAGRLKSCSSFGSPTSSGRRSTTAATRSSVIGSPSTTGAGSTCSTMSFGEPSLKVKAIGSLVSLVTSSVVIVIPEPGEEPEPSEPPSVPAGSSSGGLATVSGSLEQAVATSVNASNAMNNFFNERMVCPPTRVGVLSAVRLVLRRPVDLCPFSVPEPSTLRSSLWFPLSPKFRQSGTR